MIRPSPAGRRGRAECAATGPPPRGRSANVRVAPRLSDRHHGVLGAAAADRVAVPGHAVVAVAVQAQSRGGERLAEFAGVDVVEPARGSASSAACGASSWTRSWKLTSRGTSSTRSYICRRSARHGTTAISSSNSCSPPSSQPARTSIHAPWASRRRSVWSNSDSCTVRDTCAVYRTGVRLKGGRRRARDPPTRRRGWSGRNS